MRDMLALGRVSVRGLDTLFSIRIHRRIRRFPVRGRGCRRDRGDREFWLAAEENASKISGRGPAKDRHENGVGEYYRRIKIEYAVDHSLVGRVRSNEQRAENKYQRGNDQDTAYD